MANSIASGICAVAKKNIYI